MTQEQLTSFENKIDFWPIIIVLKTFFVNFKIFYLFLNKNKCLILFLLSLFFNVFKFFNVYYFLIFKMCFIIILFKHILFLIFKCLFLFILNVLFF